MSPHALHGHMRPAKGTSRQGARERAELLGASVGDGAAGTKAEVGAGTGGLQSWGRCLGKNTSHPGAQVTYAGVRLWGDVCP